MSDTCPKCGSDLLDVSYSYTAFQNEAYGYIEYINDAGPETFSVCVSEIGRLQPQVP